MTTEQEQAFEQHLEVAAKKAAEALKELGIQTVIFGQQIGNTGMLKLRDEERRFTAVWPDAPKKRSKRNRSPVDNSYNHKPWRKK